MIFLGSTIEKHWANCVGYEVFHFDPHPPAKKTSQRTSWTHLRCTQLLAASSHSIFQPLNFHYHLYTPNLPIKLTIGISFSPSPLDFGAPCHWQTIQLHTTAISWVKGFYNLQHDDGGTIGYSIFRSQAAGAFCLRFPSSDESPNEITCGVSMGQVIQQWYIHNIYLYIYIHYNL